MNYGYISALMASASQTTTPPVTSGVWDASLSLSPILYQNGDKRIRLPAPNQSIAKTARGVTGRATGKFYFELLLVNILGPTYGVTTGAGIAKSAFNFTGANIAGGTAGDLGVGMWPDSGAVRVYSNGAFASYSTATLGDGKRVLVAFDGDSGKIFMGVDGAWVNSGAPAAGTGAVYTFTPGATWYPAASPWSAEAGSPSDTTDVIIDLCSGSDTCVYTPPSGFSYWG